MDSTPVTLAAPPPPPNEAAEDWLRERDFDPSDPQSLRRTNSQQSTVWHRAVRRGNIMVFEWLKEKGPADLINGSNKAGYTPLMIAMDGGNHNGEESACWMMRHSDVSAMDNEQFTVFDHGVGAYMQGHLSIVFMQVM